MTCIIGFPYNGGYLVAGDRCTSDATSQDTRARKVFRTPKGVLGGAGLVAHIQHVARRWGASDGSAETLAEIVVEGVGGKPLDAEFLLRDADGLWQIDSVGAICEPSRLGIGIGSAGDYAAGYLHGIIGNLRAPLTAKMAKKIARQCLTRTARYAIGVAPPFDIYVV